jgi:hypothetical protein
MIPMKFSTIFRNRWYAVLWSIGIAWTAVEFTTPDVADPVATTDQSSDQNYSSDDIHSDTAELSALVDKLGEK